MIKTALFGLSLMLNTAVEPYQPQIQPDAQRFQLTPQQKSAALAPLMRNATECVVRAVTASPEFTSGMPPEAVNDLIVSSMEVCVSQMRAMIDAHDRLYGDGTGEAFFMGPFLEILPRAVSRQVKGQALP